MLQLNPHLPFVTKGAGRNCIAIMALDYGTDWETMFLCIMEDTRELWWIRQSELLAVENITVGRYAKPPNK